MLSPEGIHYAVSLRFASTQVIYLRTKIRLVLIPFLWLVSCAPLVLFCAPVSSADAQARNYQLFRLDSTVTVPYAHASNSWGIGAAVEPKFNLLDFLAVGVRFQGALLFGGDFSAASESLSVDLRGIVAYLAKVDLFITQSTVRPFVGFGIGAYQILGQSVSTGESTAFVDQRVGVHFGLAPQLGINFGGFRLAVTYNAIFGANVLVRQTVTVGEPPAERSTSQNYFSFEIGGTFGGRRREPPAYRPPPVLYVPPPPAPTPAPASPAPPNAGADKPQE